MKFMSHPPLPALLMQVKMAKRWIQQIVKYDGDLDVECSAPLDTLLQWDLQFACFTEAQALGSNATVDGGEETGEASGAKSSASV